MTAEAVRESGADVESGDMLVITTRASASAVEQLSISVAGRTVVVTGPAGFRHELTFPPEADTSKLRAVLYDGILELRAPRL
jgi:HSP20 family molecular chaperone IbpA